jgi:uncharacterized repeat protein (TIGR01451 family)
VVGAPYEDSNATGINGNQSDNTAGDSGAAYVFTRSGGLWSQQAYLKASNTGATDFFGQSVAVSGDTAVVGAPQEDSNATGVNGSQNDNSNSSGAAYVFTRSGGVWSQQAYLKASNAGAGDFFGTSLAMSGDTIVVSAPQEQSSSTGVNGNQGDNSLSASGAAYVFTLPTNTPPTITPATVTRQEGTSGSALIATVSDAEDAAGSLVVTVQSANPSNGVTVSAVANGAGNVTASVAAAVGASNASFTLRVTDSSGAFAEGILNVTVTPAADLSLTQSGSPDPVIINTSLTYTLTISNAGPSPATGVTVTDTLPGGVTLVSATGCTGTTTLTCSIGNLAAGASITFTITVTPVTVALITNSATVAGAEADPNTANNVASATTNVTPPPDTVGPVSSNVVANPAVVAIGNGLTLTASVDDSSTGNSVVAGAEYSLDGGPFTPMSPSDGGFNSVLENVTAAVPAFAAADVINVCVRGGDVHSNVGAAACILVAVYDPDGGFVTGGGWINSPAGAHAAQPLLTGKANFGFVSKYLPGADTPSGETEFQFKVANLNFRSSTYEWLVVAGARAQFKGTGTINNAGDYGFLLTAIDGQQPGGGGTDKFRIKIWERLSGNILYDNQIGKDDAGNDATELGGGSIIIHRP